jgi:MFS family permease
VALPAIEGDFDADVGTAQWVISAYALIFGVLIVLGGRLADLFGRRRIFFVGAAIFAVFSLLGGLAPDPWLLIACRALMGIGGALRSHDLLDPPGRARGPGRRVDHRRELDAARPGMVVLGAGVGLFYSSITTQAVTALDPSRASLAGGIVYMFQVAGGSLGLGIATAVFTARAGDGLSSNVERVVRASFESGFQATFLLVAARRLRASS